MKPLVLNKGKIPNKRTTEEKKERTEVQTTQKCRMHFGFGFEISSLDYKPLVLVIFTKHLELVRFHLRCSQLNNSFIISFI
jgi:hypothetical protein